MCGLGYILFTKTWREIFTVDRMEYLRKQFDLDVDVVEKHVVWISGRELLSALSELSESIWLGILSKMYVN